MDDQARLEALLHRIDGRPYPAWKDLTGTWRLGDLELIVDRVQGDPFAAPSKARLRVPVELPEHLCDDVAGRHATEDWLLRQFGQDLPGGGRGSGGSGRIEVYRPGPEVLERSSLRLLQDGRVEVRLTLGLPAAGRRVLGRQGRSMLLEDLPRAARRLGGGPELERQVSSVRLQRALRRALTDHGLVAFVADGSILPRASGITQRPLPGAVPFQAPDSLRLTLETPHGTVTGMGIPTGITLIVGGGFHGKSTLLWALQRGHLDHVPGDGRERVVSLPDVVKVRAEDGRQITEVDISPFLGTLPGGRTTNPFSTEDASGSTSQAAAVVEAAESGAKLLLLDEDTCATNLLVRDERMRRLIPDEKEPITPLVARVRELRDRWDMSLVMVAGGLGDWLAVADRVVAMQDYLPADVSEQARGLAGDPMQPPGPLGSRRLRIPQPASREGKKIRARDSDRLRFGDQEVDLRAVEHILDAAHAATLGEALRFVYQELIDGRRTLSQVLDALDAILEDEGVEALSPFPAPPGRLIRPRRHEVAAAFNRLRSAAVKMA